MPHASPADRLLLRAIAAVLSAIALLLASGEVRAREGSPSEWEQDALDRRRPSTELTGRSWLSVHGGYGDAFGGTSGPSLGIRFLHAPGSPGFLIGAEFVYRSFQAKIDGIPDSRIASYDLRVIGRYRLLRDWLVIPYVGGGVGLGFASLEEPEFTLISPGVFLRSYAGSSWTTRPSFGLIGIAGIDVPIRFVRALELFAELRLDGTIALRTGALDKLTSNQSTVKLQNLSTLGLVAGLSYRF